ncbi:glycine zipper family protein [Priestia koreensis]|uniref:glycine zipper family protein n=1 Tax=Priestia koreensis TaxID=284581 RepID=UPI003CFF1BDD
MNIIDKFIGVMGDLFASIFSWIIAPFTKLSSIKDLIFGRADSTNVFYTFSQKELEAIYTPGIYVMTALAAFALLGGIIIWGMKISSSGINPSTRSSFIEFLKDLAIVTIVLANLGELYAILFQINGGIVDVFSAAYDSKIKDMAKSITNEHNDVIGQLIINLTLLGLSIWANFYYMMRRLTLLLLMVMGPLMITMFLIPRFKGMTGSWMKELVGSIFVQSIHAFVFWILSKMAVGEDVVASVILYLIFIPVSESLRALLGMGGGMQGNLSKAGAMAGMSSIMAMAGAVKAAKNGTSYLSSMRGKGGAKGEGAKSDSGDGSESSVRNMEHKDETDTMPSSKADKMLAFGQKGAALGKGALGVAGAIAGAPLGDGKGAFLGAGIGTGVGNALGGAGARSAYALAQGIGNRSKKFMEGYRSNQVASVEDQISDQVADADTTAWANENKEQFMKDAKARFPDASPQALEQMWDQKVAGQRAMFKEQAMAAVNSAKASDGNMARASDLAKASAKGLANTWAEENKERFMEAYREANPPKANMTPKEETAYQQRAEQAWKSEVGRKEKEFGQMASSVASKLSNGVPNSYVSKGDFASAIAEKATAMDKASFKEAMLAKNPSMTDDQIDVEYQKTASQRQKMLMDVAQASGETVKAGSLHTGGQVNRGYLANQLATMKTADDKKTFLNHLSGSNMTPEQMEVEWQKNASDSFKGNLKVISENLQSNMSSQLIRVPSSVKGMNAVPEIAKNMAQGFVAASGVQEISKFVGETKVGSAVSNAVAGASAGYTITKMDQLPAGNMAQKVQNVAIAVQHGARAGVSAFKNTMAAPHQVINPLAKQEGFRNTVSFVAGVAGGVKMYQTGAKLAMKHNPYNQAANLAIKEVSDIAQMAQTVSGPQGVKQIAGNAIQLVTTPEQSYIQVRDHSGQTQVVSRYGAGNPTLTKGQVAYQDLTLQNGMLVNNTPNGKPVSYTVDSGGSKIPLSFVPAINPNQLLVNQRQTAQPKAEIPAFNQKVDNGSYYVQDVTQHTPKQVRMVVERDRSYMVAQNAQGETYRISPYQQGDARLAQGETVYTNCKLSDSKLIKEESYISKGMGETPYDYTSSADPNEYVPYQPNKRLAKRKEADRFRQAQGVGGSW